jgi:plastocyanin
MKFPLAIAIPLALVPVLGGCSWFGPSGTGVAYVRASQTTGHLTGRVRIMKGKRYKTSHRDAVVYLEGVPEKLPSTKNRVAEIRQVDRTFVPEVTVVLKGTTIAFPNDDREFHNVYSLSPGCTERSRNDGFDLGEYNSGTSKSVRCRRAGDVEVYCNLHPTMAAKVLVLDTTFWARADHNGDFDIAGIPAGTYRYVAWQPWGEAKTGKITIVPGESAEIDVTLKEGRKPRPARCADGSVRGAYGCKG